MSIDAGITQAGRPALRDLASAVERIYPREYVFLLAHMRSYSTLLCHVLNSSPEIAGYTEAHIKYHRASDLARLRVRVARALRRWPTGRYLLDKQLHNSMHLPRQLAALKTFKALVFIRRPGPTLASIRALAGEPRAAAWYGDWHAIARYYSERVLALAAHGVKLGDRALVFPAESIVERPETILRRIEAHLDLASPLAPRYRPEPLTGKGGHGDPSSWIHRGEIVASRPDPNRTETPPPELIAQCEDVRAHAMDVLRRWCAVA